MSVFGNKAVVLGALAAPPKKATVASTRAQIAKLRAAAKRARDAAAKLTKRSQRAARAKRLAAAKAYQARANALIPKLNRLIAQQRKPKAEQTEEPDEVDEDLPEEDEETDEPEESETGLLGSILAFLGAAPKVSHYNEEAEAHAREGGTARAVAATTIGVGGAVLTAAGAAALLPAPPFAQIAAAGIAAVGTGITVVGIIGTNQAKILAGDKSVIASYAKRVARWSRAKRKRVAADLLRQYKHHLEVGKRKIIFSKKHERDTRGWKIRKNLLALKLGAIYAVEAHARHRPKKRIVHDDPKSVPEVAETVPDDGGTLEDNTKWWLIGGAVAAGAIVLYSQRSQ